MDNETRQFLVGHQRQMNERFDGVHRELGHMHARVDDLERIAAETFHLLEGRLEAAMRSRASSLPDIEL